MCYLNKTRVNTDDYTNKTWVDKTIKSFRDAFLQDLITGSQSTSGKKKGSLFST